jgi:hypothetical protein
MSLRQKLDVTNVSQVKFTLLKLLLTTLLNLQKVDHRIPNNTLPVDKSKQNFLAYSTFLYNLGLILTLPYSSEGSPALAMFRHLLGNQASKRLYCL